MTTLSIPSLRHLRAAACAAIAAAALSGCGPVYKTLYNYTPPKGQAGRDCVRNCEMQQQNCRERLSLERQRCQVEAQRDYNDCIHRAEREKDKKDRERARSACYVSHCSSPDTEICTQDFNRCFETCGGKVTATQVCTAFCQ